MKAILTLIVIFVASITVTVAQTKVEQIKDVYHNYTHQNFVKAIIADDAVNIQISGRDQRFQSYNSIITAYKGSPIEASKFLSDVRNFYNEYDDGARTTIAGREISLRSFLGTKKIYIHSPNGIGYVIYDIKTVDRMLSALDKWANDSETEI